jgi:hypothetical protein
MGNGKVIGEYPPHDILTIAQKQKRMMREGSVKRVLANPKAYKAKAAKLYPNLNLLSGPKATNVFRIMTKTQPKAYLP